MRTFLHLEDGTTFEGEAFGHNGETQGEVVFSTAMVGYPQSLTDPSYNGQILVCTYPLIGNYGIPSPVTYQSDISANFESCRLWVRGVVVSQVSGSPSHYQSTKTISDWLARARVPGICGIDTRALTLKLREHGTLRGKISASPKASFEKETNHLVAEVSTSFTTSYQPKHKNGKHVVLIDCGVKHGILRELLTNGYKVTRIPWNKDPLAVSGIDAVICSNGPGDPKDCQETIKNIRRVVEGGTRFVGVCLGHQLLALALGADTYKLPYGHRGINQPCQDELSKKAYVTSQNHGYAVDRDSIPRGIREWFINLNDSTNEGFIDRKRNIYTTQFHPEGNPGPFDTKWVLTLL